MQEWKETYYKASTSIQHRESRLEEAANLIEINLTLLGATAIEDKLQDKARKKFFKIELIKVINLLKFSLNLKFKLTRMKKITKIRYTNGAF